MALRFQGFNGRKRFVHVFSEGDGGLEIGHLELGDIHRGERSKYDSHVHTTASDGERSPEGLASEAFAGGSTVVVTDHFCLSGADAAAAEHSRLVEEYGGECSGSGIVCGIEFSARVDLEGVRQIRKLHILGVGVDTSNRRLNEWLLNYRRLRGMDIEHALEVKCDLEGLGFRFHGNIVERLSCKRNVYQVLVESMFGNRENHRLIERRYGLRIRHLASRHKRRHKNVQIRRKLVRFIRQDYGDFTASKPQLAEIVDLIRGAGGLSVVAHPVTSVPQMPHFSVKKMTEVFMELEAEGMDGVEAYTPRHRLEVADAIAKAALDAGLLVTGGSDAHRFEQCVGVFASPVRGCFRGGSSVRKFQPHGTMV